MKIDKEKLVEFCRALIRIPSPAGKEKDAVRRAQEEMQELGFEDVELDEFGSVVGVLRCGPGPVAVFDAHIDTVGVEPINEWSRDPFGAWIEEGRLYGRGAVDMKGPTAAMVHGLASLIEERESLGGTVIASVSTLEELAEGVALGSVLNRFEPDFVVICEPSNMELIRGQRGRVELAFTTYGEPAHSSTPELGVDAVAKMMKLIARVDAMELPVHPFLGRGVQALTDIISTPYPAQSTVPAKCRATFDRRLVVGENESSIARETHDVIEAAKNEDNQLVATTEIVTAEIKAYTGHKFDFSKFIPAWETEADSDIVTAAARGLEAAGLLPGPPDYYRFCTNGSWACVHAGLPTIGYGPGNAALAHRVDEYTEIDQLEAAATGYAAIAKKLIG